jgi:integrase
MPTLGLVSARDKLKVQHEPHWLKLSGGCYLGFRRLTATSTGSWLARFRDEDGRQHKQSLGEFAEVPPSHRFDAAKRAAEAWFEHLGKGGSAENITVRVACERYVQQVRGHRGDLPADDMHMRFKRWVYGDRKLSDTELAKLTKTRVEAWRLAMTKTPAKVSRSLRAAPVTRDRSASSVNRDIAVLRAALNFAHDAGSVTTDMAWRVALRPTKNAGGRRDLYLDRDQRRALIAKASADVGAFLRGLSLVPLRPGAVAALTVSSFDIRRQVLTIGKDKAGKDRKIKLPTSTAAIFESHCDGKEPTDPLLCREDGKAWNKDAWKGPIKLAATLAELPAAATAYTIRHSVITDLVTNGLDLLTVAQLSGTSVAMIERHYGHLRADIAAAALSGLAL